MPKIQKPSVMLKTHYFGHKVAFQHQQISVRSQKSCLTIQKETTDNPKKRYLTTPKKMPDDPKKGA